MEGAIHDFPTFYLVNCHEPFSMAWKQLKAANGNGTGWDADLSPDVDWDGFLKATGPTIQSLDRVQLVNYVKSTGVVRRLIYLKETLVTFKTFCNRNTGLILFPWYRLAYRIWPCGNMRLAAKSSSRLFIEP